MKKHSTSFIIAITIAVVFVAVLIIYYILGYVSFISQVDVQYVYKLEKALQNYDIVSLDECLADDVEILYNDESKTYLYCRENILENMHQRNYTISIYGGGDNIFKNGIQKISTQVYGSVLGEDCGENCIIVYLKRIDINSFKIVKLESNDEILKKLFFEKN